MSKTWFYPTGVCVRTGMRDVSSTDCVTIPGFAVDFICETLDANSARRHSECSLLSAVPFDIAGGVLKDWVPQI